MQIELRSVSRPARVAAIFLPLVLLLAAAGCSRGKVQASGTDTVEPVAPTVGVTSVALKPMDRQLTVSSELVPFQEIDVYAKESGYVKKLNVDYGSRVKEGDVMAILEIPELEQLIQQDKAAIQRAKDMITHADQEISRLQAQQTVADLEYNRLHKVFVTKPGLIAQQEIDDAQGKDLAAEAQVEAGKAALLAAQSQLDQANAKLQQDTVLFDYSKITAPFDGVVTQRYANYGTLMQAGTSSSTQVLPLVRLSEDKTFRLVIPVAESYVKYIKIGQPVQVKVPSLDRVLTGTVARFSVDVTTETRTMHTEVDVPNPSHVLMPGLYAEATITLEHKPGALVVPLEAVNRNGDDASVLMVDMNNHVQDRKITLGLMTASEAEVLSGLNQGDRVVVSDRSGLKAGEEVKPKAVEMMQYTSENSGQ